MAKGLSTSGLWLKRFYVFLASWLLRIDSSLLVVTCLPLLPCVVIMFMWLNHGSLDTDLAPSGYIWYLRPLEGYLHGQNKGDKPSQVSWKIWIGSSLLVCVSVPKLLPHLVKCSNHVIFCLSVVALISISLPEVINGCKFCLEVTRASKTQWNLPKCMITTH